jgi:uncharacterized membrane protein YfcA
VSMVIIKAWVCLRDEKPMTRVRRIPLLRRYTLKQLFLYITWMCVGFGGISFALRKWDLPNTPSYDWLADLEGIVRLAALVVGWTVVCAAATCLATTRRRGAILIAALVAMIPGAFVGAVIGSILVGPGDTPPVCAIVGAALMSGLVILASIVPTATVEERQAEMVSERESSKKGS